MLQLRVDRYAMAMALTILTPCLAPRALSQTSVVVPAKLATTEGRHVATVPTTWWSATGNRYQQIVRAAGVAKNVLTLRSIAFRRDNDIPMHFAQRRSPAMRLELGIARTTPNTMQAAFAANRSKPLATHFQGSVLLPQAFHAGKGPSPFDIKIALSRPYTHVVRSGDLLIEMSFAKSRPITDVWAFDAHVEESSGQARWFGRSGAPSARLTVARRNLVTGGRLEFISTGYGAHYPALVLLGGSSSSFGAFRLPLDLTAIGARGSFLHVRPDIVIPVRGSQKSYRTYLRIPPDEKLAGARLYAQYAFFVQLANPAGLTMSSAVELTVGRAPQYDSMAITSHDLAARIGVRCVDPAIGGAPVVELGGTFR